jgi:hypothetical protein
MRLLACAVLCCLLSTCPRGATAYACTSFCMDTPDGPVFGANLDLFIPGDGLVLVNRRGIAKESYATAARSMPSSTAAGGGGGRTPASRPSASPPLTPGASASTRAATPLR